MNETDVWMQDYPSAVINVISPELPCGASWLANCFIELGIPVWLPWNMRNQNEWERLGICHYRYIEKNHPWKQVLPSLKYGKEYRFKPGVSAAFSHHWPVEASSSDFTILFVRDPRDALFSQWRRLKHNAQIRSISFIEFLASNYHHYPISQQEYLFLFYQLWRDELSNKKYMIVRYEDYKSNPEATLVKVADFIQQDASQQSICAAVERSDVKILKKIEQQLEETKQLDYKFTFSGQSNEHRQHFTAEMYAGMSDLFTGFYDWLGYDQIAEQKSNLRSFSSGASHDQMISLLNAFGLADNLFQKRGALERQLHSYRHCIAARD